MPHEESHDLDNDSRRSYLPRLQVAGPAIRGREDRQAPMPEMSLALCHQSGWHRPRHDRPGSGWTRGSGRTPNTEPTEGPQMTGERFTLTITAVASNRTATQRLRCLLKTLLRSHGFRCDRLQPALHDEPSGQHDGSETVREDRTLRHGRAPHDQSIESKTDAADAKPRRFVLRERKSLHNRLCGACSVRTHPPEYLFRDGNLLAFTVAGWPTARLSPVISGEANTQSVNVTSCSTSSTLGSKT